MVTINTIDIMVVKKKTIPALQNDEVGVFWLVEDNQCCLLLQWKVLPVNIWQLIS